MKIYIISKFLAKRLSYPDSPSKKIKNLVGPAIAGC
jgi:hypothetical protein